ncbi:hypothetical protein KKB68_02815, partial [Patescibacteria group bacterium]|nr:hypothetical protein [Patescibacteria group bacterium]
SEGTHVAKVRVERDVANPAEGTATVTVTVPNQPPIAVATISKDGTNYADSIAVTQGISTHIYLSASGSSDPDGWTDSVNGVSSGGKCEWNSDLNQGPPTFERTINNPASPSACNIDLGNLTFNDAPGAYTYQALRITDKPGAVSNIDTVTVNVVCQCTSGACCDGCNYRPNTYVCGYSVWNSCNGSCQKKRDVYKCTGSSTACPTTDQGDDYENCGSGTACSGGSCSSANYCATNLCRDGGIWHHNCDKQCDGSNNCTVWADTTCSDHCDPVTSGVQDCDETAIDCGGFCGACNIPPSVVNLSVDSPNSTDYCGITTYPPVRVHWQFDDTGDTQSAFQIKVLQGGVEVIDTGKEFSVISREYVFQNSGEQLSWNTAYTWKVKVWDSLDVESGWVFGPAFSTSHAYPDPDFTLSSPNPSVDEVVSFNPDNSQPYGGAAITNYQWTITQGSGSFVDSTTSVSRYPSIKFSTRANKVELRVTDSSGYACYKEKDVDVQLPLPEWREIAPTSFLEKFLANISMGFSQIFDFF